MSYKKQGPQKNLSKKTYKDQNIDQGFVDNELGVNANPEELRKTLKIKPLPEDVLDSYEKRLECPECLRMSGLFYCVECSKCLLDEKDLPKIDMGLTVQIIKHLKEKSERSSAYPLIFLSEKFELYETKADGSIPKSVEYSEGNDYVLYPHKDARLISELPEEELKNMKSIKIIDCTWGQAKSILRNIPMDKAKFIKLEDYETTFWRHQLHNSKCLATVEAIYYM